MKHSICSCGDPSSRTIEFRVLVGLVGPDGHVGQGHSVVASKADARSESAVGADHDRPLQFSGSAVATGDTGNVLSTVVAPKRNPVRLSTALASSVDSSVAIGEDDTTLTPTELAERLDTLTATLEERSDEIDALESRMDDLEEQPSVEDLESQIEEMTIEQSDLEDQLTALRDWHEEQAGLTEFLKAELTTLREEHDALKVIVARLDAMRDVGTLPPPSATARKRTSSCRRRNELV